MSISSENQWPRPVLDRAGQRAFWDRQAGDYDHAEMTIDNEGELDLVRTLCHQFCRNGYEAEDVVTLGGAVGSRDPKVVTEVLEHHATWPKHIYFNDLSEPMTKQALEVTLALYPRDRTKVVVLPGPIHEIGTQIPAVHRRVVVGVYRAEALISTNPGIGYSLSGLERYGRNADKIGTHLIIEPVRLTTDGYAEFDDIHFHYSNGDSSEQKGSTRVQVQRCLDLGSVDALRVIGRHETHEGYFLSHWFTEQGIRRLVANCFAPERISSMSLMPCAKGFVLCIDPTERPLGIVTMLNNVIGNVLPDEQFETLRTIDRFSR